MTIRFGRRRALCVLGLGLAAMVLAGAAPRVGPVPKPRPATGAQSSAVFKAAPSTPRHGSAIARSIDLSGNHGWMVVDLATGKVIEEHQAGRAFAPASVAKLPSAFYAIDTLGPDFRFETSVAVTGTLSGGRLAGDLVLIGGGDPELDSDALAPLAEEASAAGVRRIDGRFLIDATIGPRIPELDPGQPDDVTYNPAVSGLNLNFNRVRLEWNAAGGQIKTSALGEKYNPPVRSVRVDVDGQPNAPVFDHSYAPGAEVWRMASRAFRGKGARWLPVRRPELYAAEVFRDFAGSKGLSLPKAAETRAPDGARVIAVHRGRPLTGVVKSMLKFSTNLTAEAIGVRASAADGPVPATLVHSARAMNDWAARLGGFAPNDPAFRFHNHSGLSTESRVSPERLVALLKVIGAREPVASQPDPRIPGALSGLLKEHNIREKGVSFDYDRTFVAAKTGTMNYVRGLAGFISTPGEKKLAFAYFANDIPRRDAGGATNKSWLARARRLERALIRHWTTRADAG